MNKNRYDKISKNLQKKELQTRIKPFLPTPKTNDYKRGYVVRYFVQSTNESSPIYEVNESAFSRISSNPFYKTTQLDWRLTGKKSEVEKSNNISVSIASKVLPHLKLYLPNLVQYYDPSYYTEPTLDKKTPEETDKVTVRETGSAFQNSPDVFPGIPQNVAIDGETYEVTWDSESSALGYNLYLSYNSEGFVKYNEELITDEFITLENLSIGDYELYVTSVKDEFESSPSDIVVFTYSAMLISFTEDDFQTSYHISDEILEVTESQFEGNYHIADEILEVTESQFEGNYHISDEILEVTQSQFEGTIDKPTAPSNLQVTVVDLLYSLSFDGNDYVTVGDVLDINNSSQTWMCWYKTTNYLDTDAFRIIEKRGQGGFGTASGMQLSAARDSLGNPGEWRNTALEDVSGNFVGGTAFNVDMPQDSGWHHVALVWDNSTGTLSLYVDFTLVASDTNATMIGADCSTTRPLEFGRANTDAQYFNGGLDEVQIWDSALSQVEIEENAQKTLNGDEVNLLGYWKFNEGTGSVAGDATANNNDGTITGAIYSTDTPPPFAEKTSLFFDGVNDNVDINTIYTGYTSVELEAYIKISSYPASFAGIAGQGYLAADDGFGLFLRSTGVVSFQVRNDATTVTADSNTLSLNTWYKVKGVRDFANNETRIYVDDILIDIATGSLPNQLNSTYSFNVGRVKRDSGLDFHFNGFVDEVKLSSGGTLIGEWKFDEGSGAIALDSAGNNDGTITGAIYSTDTPF